MIILLRKTNREKLEECCWKYRHQDDLDNKVFSRIIRGIEVTIVLFDDEEAEVHVGFDFVRRAILPDDLIEIGNELKRLEEN